MPEPASYTRGYGFLENLLARKRCLLANKLIEPCLRAGRILDIGCGEHPYFLLTTEFQERYGLDQIVNAQAAERFRAHRITLVKHDLHRTRRLPFDDGSFDAVTMLAVIEHLEAGAAAELVQEIRRVLKPNGLFVLTTPAAWSDRLLRMMAAVRLISPVEFEEHQVAYTPLSLRRLLEHAGFPAEAVHTGMFELYLNLWATARKPAGTAQ